MSKFENATRALPENPNLENLKKQARTLLKAIRAGSPVSTVELARLKQTADLAGLIALALAHCDASTKQAVLASSDPKGLVSALCDALEPILDQASPRPLGTEEGVRDYRDAEAWLLVAHAARHPHLLGRRYALAGEATNIGRGTANQVLLHSDSVSREHARIERRDSGFVLVDRESTNGCFVNEAPEAITERVLQDGDRLAIGDAVLVFLAGPELEQKYCAAIEYLTQHDALTRTRNQQAWLAATERQILYARGSNEALSALLLDIDQLYELSTRIGQLGGNALLLRVAQVLHEELGPGALIGRHSEGQFVITLPRIDAAGATAVANRLREVVGSRSLLLFGEAVSVTVSVGVATLYRTTGTDELLDDARAALARAQGAGRNAVRGPREVAA